jgi:hypothetical protein
VRSATAPRSRASLRTAYREPGEEAGLAHLRSPAANAGPTGRAPGAQGPAGSWHRYYDRRNSAPPLDDRSCVVKTAHMGVAGGESAICLREARVVLDCEQQLWDGLIQSPSEEMRAAYQGERHTAGAWAEAQRSFEMLDRDVGLARPKPQDAADTAAPREARVKRQCAIHQCHHRADVLAEIGQRQGGIGKDARVIAGHLQGSLANAGPFRRCASRSSLRSSKKQPLTAHRRQGESGPVVFTMRP